MRRTPYGARARDRSVHRDHVSSPHVRLCAAQSGRLPVTIRDVCSAPAAVQIDFNGTLTRAEGGLPGAFARICAEHGRCLDVDHYPAELAGWSEHQIFARALEAFGAERSGRGRSINLTVTGSLRGGIAAPPHGSS
jgi:hypothetical protein